MFTSDSLSGIVELYNFIVRTIIFAIAIPAIYFLFRGFVFRQRGVFFYLSLAVVTVGMGDVAIRLAQLWPVMTFKTFESYPSRIGDLAARGVTSLYLDWDVAPGNIISCPGVIGCQHMFWRANPSNATLEIGGADVRRVKLLYRDPECLSGNPDIIRFGYDQADVHVQGFCLKATTIPAPTAEFTISASDENFVLLGDEGIWRHVTLSRSSGEVLEQLSEQIYRHSVRDWARPFEGNYNRRFDPQSDSLLLEIARDDGPIIDQSYSDVDRKLRYTAINEDVLLAGFAHADPWVRGLALLDACTQWDRLSAPLRQKTTDMLALLGTDRVESRNYRRCGVNSCTKDRAGIGNSQTCETPPPAL